MPTTPVQPPPTRDGGPLTAGEVAYLFNVSRQAVQNWITKGALGKTRRIPNPNPRGGAPVLALDPGPVLNFGLITGRLDAYWNLIGDDGRIADRNGPRRASGARPHPPAPTMDLSGRRYFYASHIAPRFGVPEGTARGWRDRPRSGFPSPDTVVEGRPTWFEPTLVKWGQTSTPARLDENGDPLNGNPAQFKGDSA
jgi:transposase